MDSDSKAGCAMVVCIILALSPFAAPIMGIMLCAGFVAVCVWFLCLGPSILIGAIKRIFGE